MNTTKKSKTKAAVGRKRDHRLDAQILEAAINILAEIGFDRMTMDMVAARTQSGKTTLYRRWPSKPELVRDALIWMSRSSMDLDDLPDTGTLRGDLLATMKPHSAEYSERKLRVIAGLGSFSTQHQKFADQANAGIFEPIIQRNLILMQRAVERGEISARANLELACQAIVSMISYRVHVQKKTVDKAFYAEFLDSILLPALKSRNH